MLESAALLVEAVVGLIHQPVCKSSRVGSAETSSVSSSTSSRVGAVPDMIGGSGSSKGGRGLGGSSRNGVEKRIHRIGVSVSGSGDSRFVSSSFPSSGGLLSIRTGLRGANVGLPIARKSICLGVSSVEG